MYESDFKAMINNNSILEKHIELLRDISDSRIMCVGYDEDGFYLMECCDEYFVHNLTKEECLGLSEMFAEIAEVIN